MDVSKLKLTRWSTRPRTTNWTSPWPTSIAEPHLRGADGKAPKARDGDQVVIDFIGKVDRPGL